MQFNSHRIVSVHVDALTLIIIFKGAQEMADICLSNFIDIIGRSTAWSNLTRMYPRVQGEDRLELNTLASSIFR